MSYKTTIDSLTKGTLVYVDTLFNTSDEKTRTVSPTLSKSSYATTTSEDRFKHRFLNATVIRVENNDQIRVAIDSIDCSMGSLMITGNNSSSNEEAFVYGGGENDLVMEEDVNDDQQQKHKVMVCSVDQLFLRNPETSIAADDITTVTYLHEAALLHNLVSRYHNQVIYTYTGPILIAINPYQQMPKSLYGRETIEAYRGQMMGKLSPHVYALAENCFSSMMNEGKNQSILVSGESGAGKTETTKILLNYFAAMSNKNDVVQVTTAKTTMSPTTPTTPLTTKLSIENQVLASTPLLEAFGNAKTLRNDNSSRFGKFIEVQFSNTGVIAGAFIQTYLLEKSRVTKQTIGERNYHIFYQLCASCNDDEAQELLMGQKPSDFHYLNQSDCYTIDGVSDAEVFQQTRQAMDSIGISESEQKSVKRVLAAILHFGNVEFSENNDSHDSCSIVDMEPLKKACSLLQVDDNAIAKTFLTRKVIAGRESYNTPLKVDQAESSRDALAMLLYSRMFDWIVKRMNDNINNPGQSKHTIGVLDIYGFESFENNSFEQFCINWANEKLQQQYNQHVFKLSQQEYIREQINWSMLQFNDNQITLDLIESSKMSILNILDEECRFPKADERTFSEKLYTNHSSHSCFSKPRFSSTAFTLSHYADQVTYDSTHFLNKNKDYIIPEQVELFRNNNKDLVIKEIFNLDKQKSGGGNSSFKFVSVASQFKQSLAMLMDRISQTYPNYIRCIKPNSQKKPNMFNFELVLQQLKCGGILESIRICLEGYPTKKLFHEFIERYSIVFPDETKESDPKKACLNILKKMNIPEESYQFGHTKVFLRSGQIERIEMIRQHKLNAAAIIIQKNSRAYVKRKWWVQLRGSTLKLQQVFRTCRSQLELDRIKEHHSSIVIGSVFKSVVPRAHMALHTRQLFLIQNSATVQLGVSNLVQKKATLQLALVVQSSYRHSIRRRDYMELLAESNSLKTIQKQKEGLAVKIEELQYQAMYETKARSQLEEDKALLESRLRDVSDQVQQTQDAWSKKYEVVESTNEELRQEINRLNKKLKEEVEMKSQTSIDQDVLDEVIQESEKKYDKERVKNKSELQKANKRIEELLLELEQERKQRLMLEKKLNSQEVARLRTKKRRQAEMAWEIERALMSFTRGDNQERAERFVVMLIFELERTFADNIIPTCALLIYNLVMCWRNDIDGCERLFTLIENSMKASIGSATPDVLPFWFSTSASLLQLFSSKEFLQMLPHIQQEDSNGTAGEAIQSIQSRVVHLLQTESYVTLEQQLILMSEREFDKSTDPDIFVQFIFDITSVFIKGYAQLIEQITSRIGTLLKIHKVDEAYSESRRTKSSFETVVNAIKQEIDELQGFNLSEILMEKIIKQIISYVDSVLFNEVMLRREICSSVKAAQVKDNITKLEQKISKYVEFKVNLTLVDQAVALLLLPDKRALLEETTRATLIPNLNGHQILKLLQMYNSDFESKIPEQVIHYFRTIRPAIIQVYPDNSVILDTKTISSFDSLEEITNDDIEASVPYLSFPIAVKERLEQTMKREQEVSAVRSSEPIVSVSPPQTQTPISPPNAQASSVQTPRRFSFFGKR